MFSSETLRGRGRREGVDVDIVGNGDMWKIGYPTLIIAQSIFWRGGRMLRMRQVIIARRMPGIGSFESPCQIINHLCFKTNFMI